jgi:Ala-tRNA(Pro) deacylase
MITTEKEFLDYLDGHGFHYQRVEHAPVYTCAEAERERPPLPAASLKNLFLRDKKGRRFFLAVTACEKSLDFSRLAEQVSVSKLSFGSEGDLERLLGVGRGAVTVLGLVNDADHRVELWVDAQVWASENFLCHPLVNTATLVLSKESLERFFALGGHTVHLFEA